MTHEEKVKILEIFNRTTDTPWTDEEKRQLMYNYRVWAAALTGPIVKRIDESGLRKSIKVVKLNRIKKVNGVAEANPLVVKPGTRCWNGSGYKPYIVKKDGLVKSVTAQAAGSLRLGRVTPRKY
jgi:hypothetical protein